jgi:hypothetical protein
MSTPSMVLFGAGVAASLTGVWTLAGLSERSNMRPNARVVVATTIGMVGLLALYQRAPAELRAQLLLPALFGAVSVLALAAGAAKQEAALADRDGPRAVRRAAGLIAGTFLGMASVAAVSLELLPHSLAHARFGWSCMLPGVVAALIVFAQRGRLAGAGALALGRRGLILGILGLGLLIVARTLVTANAAAAPRQPAPSHAEAPPAAAVVPSPAPASAPLASAAAQAALASAAAPSGAEPSQRAPGAEPAAQPGAARELLIENVLARGMLEADARGGVARRMSKLQACLQDPNNQQSGALSLKIGIDAAGSVTYSKATGGDLVGTPLGACLLPVFYKMGFAAPASSTSTFEITLRAPAR